MFFSAGSLTRSGQGFLLCHSSSKSLVEGLTSKPEDFEPLRQRLRLLVDRYVAVLCRVASLFLVGGPAAVLWLVIAVHVDAIEGVLFGRAPTHILQKALERASLFRIPAGAHKNASSPVAAERVVALVRTTREHLRPAAILRCLCSAGALPVLATSAPPLHAPFTAVTSTGFCASFLQKDAQTGDSCSAIAKALPLSAANVAESSQATVFVSGDVDSSRHLRNMAQER